MTKKKAPETDSKPETQGQESQTMQNLPLKIHAQYIRDISFENPKAPNSLRGGLEPPKIDISSNMDVRNLEDETIKALYEVAFKVSAVAKREEETVFIAEVEYGVVVELSGVPEDKHHPLLLIEVPRLIFPFIRQMLSDVTQNGGFPPLLLNPIDFTQLYHKNFMQKNKPETESQDAKSA